MSKMRPLPWGILGALLFCFLARASRADEQHPRLFVTPERLFVK